MWSQIRQVAPAWHVACTQIGAESRPKRCLSLRFLKPSERSEIGMRVAERATPVAAVMAALSTLACCLPLGFLGAAGLAGASVWLQPMRPWLLASAAVLLAIGFVQIYAKRN